MRQFAKPAISVAEQIALLKERGLEIQDEARAGLFLRAVSFFSLNTLHAAVSALGRS